MEPDFPITLNNKIFLYLSNMKFWESVSLSNNGDKDSYQLPLSDLAEVGSLMHWVLDSVASPIHFNLKKNLEVRNSF